MSEVTSGMAIIVPTFNRPANVERLARAFRDTVLMDSTSLHFVLQHEDPSVRTYNTATWRESIRDLFPNVVFPVADLGIGGKGFVRPTNWHAYRLLKRARPPQYIGFMGDDHLPRTVGWDRTFATALSEPGAGYVYGDDGFQGAGLTTHVVMKRKIPEALGYFAFPDTRHLYADNIWHYTGSASRTLRYCGDVLIEHMHPHAGGKADFDSTYEIGNHTGRWLDDGHVFEKWKYGTDGHDARALADVRIVADLKREGKI